MGSARCACRTGKPWTAGTMEGFSPIKHNLKSVVPQARLQSLAEEDISSIFIHCPSSALDLRPLRKGQGSRPHGVSQDGERASSCCRSILPRRRPVYRNTPVTSFPGQKSSLTAEMHRTLAQLFRVHHSHTNTRSLRIDRLHALRGHKSGP